MAQGMQLTHDGWQRLQDELSALEDQRRSLDGDTTDDLRGDLAALDIRISELQDVLARAIPVTHADREPGTAGVGTRVTVCWDDGEEETYAIVGPPEVEALVGRISYESPVGRALLGRRAGDRIAVSTPNGSTGLEIRAVEEAGGGPDGRRDAP